MNRNEALSLVLPVHSGLVKLVCAGMEDFLEFNPEEVRATLGPTARANYVHERQMYHAEMAFGTAGQIRVVTQGQLRYIQIDGEDGSIGVRIKKLRRNTHRSCNYRTGQQQQILAQGVFPFADDVAQIIVGYVEGGDDINPFVQQVMVTRETLAGVERLCTLWTSTDGEQPFLEVARPFMPTKPGVVVVPDEKQVRRLRSEGG